MEEKRKKKISAFYNLFIEGRLMRTQRYYVYSKILEKCKSFLKGKENKEKIYIMKLNSYIEPNLDIIKVSKKRKIRKINKS